MAYKRPVKKTRSRLKDPKTLLAVLVVAVAVVAGLELTNTTHIFHKQTPVTRITPSTIKSSLPPTSTTAPADKQPTSGSTTSTGQGTDVDNKGKVTTPPTTNSRLWTASQSGVITVKQPTAQTTFKSGDTVSGSASVPQVQYRLIDDQTGILTEGSLSVVNGNFSGTLQFQPVATTGRLDVFTVNAAGVESNEVEISVNF